MPPVIDVAAAVIRHDGRYLICRRKPEDTSGGLWEFPGGKREDGETLEACVVREIMEELGCGIAAGPCLAVVDSVYGDRAFRIHFLEARLVSGTPRTIECSELAWVTPGELGRYDFLKPNLAILPLLAGSGAPAHREEGPSTP